MGTAVRISRELLADLYRAHWVSLVGTATWLTGDRQLGEEIAQDAYIRLIEHWSRIKDPLAAPAWLRRTVINLSRTQNRRFAIGRQKRELIGASTATSDDSASALGDALANGPLGDAIRKLPRRQRECIVLRFVHDLAVDQIAATLDISAGSVKTHLHRATAQLETALETP